MVSYKQIEESASLQFIKQHENIILLGQSGVGRIDNIANTMSFTVKL